MPYSNDFDVDVSASNPAADIGDLSVALLLKPEIDAIKAKLLTLDSCLSATIGFQRLGTSP